MKKLLILLLLVLTVVLVVSCTPQGASGDPAIGDGTSEVSESDEEEDEEESGALAGQAVASGGRCDLDRVCSDDQVCRRKISRRTGKLYGSVKYCKLPITPGGPCDADIGRETDCQLGYACQNGRCVSLCGNGVEDIYETCASCTQDVMCSEGFACIGDSCLQQNLSVGSDCSNNLQCNSGLCGVDQPMNGTRPIGPMTRQCELPNEVGEVCLREQECREGLFCVATYPPLWGGRMGDRFSQISSEISSCQSHRNAAGMFCVRGEDCMSENCSLSQIDGGDGVCV